MSRVVTCLTRTAPWGLAILAGLFGGLTVVWFGSSAAYFWFETEPRSVPIGLFWFAVAVSIPTAAEVARRNGLRRGERGGALVTRVSATTLAAVWCAITIATALWLAAVFLGL